MSATDMTLKEATELLTVGEVKWVQKHFHRSFGDLDGMETLVAVTLLHERRKAMREGTPVPDLDSMDGWTLRQLNDYYAPEPIEIDEDDPDSDQGKESGTAAQ